MKFRKVVCLLVLTMLLGGSAIAVEGCFEGPPAPAYGYGASYYPYYPTPAYIAPGPVVYGDWDEHHRWHDRDWWMANRRAWVESHHHEWLEGRLAHEGHEHHEWH